MAVLIVSDGSIGKDISRWEMPEEWRRDFDRALIRRRTRLSLGWRSRKQFTRRQETPAPPDSSESQGGDTEPKEVTTLTLYHFITRTFRSSRFARTGLTLGGALALVLAISAFTAGPAQAASFRFQRGYSVQHSWLCYGWPNGALHCTAHWHRTASGKLVSDNPAWVPNVGGTTSSGSGSGGSGGAEVAAVAAAQLQPASASGRFRPATTPMRWVTSPVIPIMRTLASVHGMPGIGGRIVGC